MLVVALLLLLAPAADTVRTPGVSERLGLGLTLGAGLELPMSQADPASFGPDRPGPKGTNAAMRVTVSGHAFHHLTASVSFYRYLVPRLQAPWDPDFVYSVTYDAHWPRGVTLTYANYDANRLLPRADQVVTHVDRGVISVSYAPRVPDPLRRLVRIDRTSGFYPRVSYDVIPTYYDNVTGDFRHGKHRVGVGAYLHAFGGWFVAASAHAYPDPERQQPWDPDFAYVFGYSRGWPDRLTVQYANFTGTRFPWRTPTPGTGRFGLGMVSVAWSRRF